MINHIFILKPRLRLDIPIANDIQVHGTLVRPFPYPSASRLASVVTVTVLAFYNRNNRLGNTSHQRVPEHGRRIYLRVRIPVDLETPKQKQPNALKNTTTCNLLQRKSIWREPMGQEAFW